MDVMFITDLLNTNGNMPGNYSISLCQFSVYGPVDKTLRNQN